MTCQRIPLSAGHERVLGDFAFSPSSCGTLPTAPPPGGLRLLPGPQLTTPARASAHSSALDCAWPAAGAAQPEREHGGESGDRPVRNVRIGAA